MSIERTSASTSFVGAAAGGGATSFSAGGFEAVTGGRASGVVVGAFFLQAAKGRTAIPSSMMVMRVEVFFIPFSLARAAERE